MMFLYEIQCTPGISHVREEHLRPQITTDGTAETISRNSGCQVHCDIFLLVMHNIPQIW
jgi:hypothetical protein